jgi:hypothetical protein
MRGSDAPGRRRWRRRSCCGESLSDTLLGALERKLMERIGFDLLGFRWFVYAVNPCRSPRAPQRTGTDF